MDSQNILYSSGKNDECYTPKYAVIPLLKYLDKSKTIWCPFDTEDSQYVKIFKENGFKVINSHIEYEQDFYNYEPEEDWDVIVSNPPFTNKRKIFERAISFGKPFALLMSNTWLNDSAPMQLFKDLNWQMLFFDKRIKFLTNGKVENKITFGSSYYCRDLLPKQIIVESLSKNNMKENDA